MFRTFQKASFHNVVVDTGSYMGNMDMEVSQTGSVNASDFHYNPPGPGNIDNIAIVSPARHSRKTHKSSHPQNVRQNSLQSTFSSPWLETTWTATNIAQFVLFLLLQTFLPLYRSLGNQLFRYPITWITIQLLLCSLLLLLYNLSFFHCCADWHPATSSTVAINRRRRLSLGAVSRSSKFSKTANNSAAVPLRAMPTMHESPSRNMFHTSVAKFIRHCCNKSVLKLCLIPALFYALDTVVCSIGIAKGSMDIHIFLKATEILWFLLLSPYLLTDFPTASTVTSAVICTIGAVFFSWSTIDRNDVTVLVVCCNLLSAVFKPFQILFLRRATRILTVEESETRTMDGVDVMTVAEIAMCYLLLSACVLIPFQLALEGERGWRQLHENYGTSCNWSVIAIGAVLLLMQQWNLVGLVSNAEPILIGIGEQSQQLWRVIVSFFVSGVTLKICDCVYSDSTDGDHCDVDVISYYEIHAQYPECPCFSPASNVFNGSGFVLHWFGVLLIVLGFVFYCYLKLKNMHVTNVNIFKCVGQK